MHKYVSFNNLLATVFVLFLPSEAESQNIYTGDVCHSHPCQNYGSCMLGPGYGFTCHCTVTSFGTLCEYDLFCDSNPCQNGGTCALTVYGSFCDCPTSFSGAACELAVILPSPMTFCDYECQPAANSVARCEPLRRRTYHDELHIRSVQEDLPPGAEIAMVTVQGNDIDYVTSQQSLISLDASQYLSVRQALTMADSPVLINIRCINHTDPHLVRWPNMQRTLTITVHLTDINNHVPSIEINSSMVVSEWTLPGERLWQVELKDADPSNLSFNVSIIRNTSTDWDALWYDAESWTIFLARMVNFEWSPTIRFIMHIEDNHPLIRNYVDVTGRGIPQIRHMSADYTFVASVANENDETPAFPQPIYNAYLLPGGRQGDVLTFYPTILGHDDDDPNQILVYSLHTHDEDQSWDEAIQYYSINSSTAEITQMNNDSYSRGFVKLIIRACELEQPSSCGNSTLKITPQRNITTDPPVLGRYEYEASVNENRSVGMVILRVTVTNEQLVRLPAHSISSPKGHANSGKFYDRQTNWGDPIPFPVGLRNTNASYVYDLCLGW